MYMFAKHVHGINKDLRYFRWPCFTEIGCGFLVKALRSNLTHLKELHLSYNHPQQLDISNYIKNKFLSTTMIVPIKLRFSI